MSGSRLPAFTPMRIGSPRSLASRATSLMCSPLRMLPGFSRSACTPASIAASARRYWKWMSAMIGTGDRGTIWASPSAASSSLQVQRTMSQPAAASAVDLGQRALDVRGLGGGHRLHRDGRVAPHGHAGARRAADEDLAGRAALEHRRVSLRPSAPWASGPSPIGDHDGKFA